MNKKIIQLKQAIHFPVQSSDVQEFLDSISAKKRLGEVCSSQSSKGNLVKQASPKHRRSVNLTNANLMNSESQDEMGHLKSKNENFISNKSMRQNRTSQIVQNRGKEEHLQTQDLPKTKPGPESQQQELFHQFNAEIEKSFAE